MDISIKVLKLLDIIKLIHYTILKGGDLYVRNSISDI